MQKSIKRCGRKAKNISAIHRIEFGYQEQVINNGYEAD